MTEEHRGLAPLTAEAKARRKRQNRIVIPLLVLILVPVLALAVSNRYINSVRDNWVSGPTFPFNVETTVPLTAGDYVVWTYSAEAECTVTHAGSPVPTTTAESPVSQAGLYISVQFTAHSSDDYELLCLADAESGHAMVSTPAPLTQLGLALLLGYAVAGAGVVTGVVLLIIGLATNYRERRPPSPRIPLGASPYAPGQHPWPNPYAPGHGPWPGAHPPPHGPSPGAHLPPHGPTARTPPQPPTPWRGGPTGGPTRPA